MSLLAGLRLGLAGPEGVHGAREMRRVKIDRLALLPLTHPGFASPCTPPAQECPPMMPPTPSAFYNALVEDRSPASGMSYVEFLCFLHRQIQNKLS